MKEIIYIKEKYCGRITINNIENFIKEYAKEAPITASFYKEYNYLSGITAITLVW